MARDTGRTDASGGFRARLDRSEREWNAALNRVMEGELFAGLLDAGSAAWLTLNDVANDTRRRAWHALGLPTRDDIVNLARHLGELEDQLQRVERRLGQLGADDPARGAGPGAAKRRDGRPRRTRKPPGGE
jgi:hypothetical protein